MDGEHEIGDPPDEVEDEDEAERQHFRRVVRSFQDYELAALRCIGRVESQFHGLPSHQRALVAHYEARLDELRKAAAANQRLLDLIVAEDSRLFENSDDLRPTPNAQCHDPPSTQEDISRVYTTLKQLVRDWSAEGEQERAVCYDPLIDALTQRVEDAEARARFRVLVPGAGLGRLVWEYARHGFVAQGNEFSMHMLLTSNFVLNRSLGRLGHPVCPYVHEFLNVYSVSDQARTVLVPDVDFAATPLPGDMSMTAGDFLDVYCDRDAWDAVATCFFLDTARNVIDYVERIALILRPGGVWVNLGPLLYHFASTPGAVSIELAYDELRHVIQASGFDLVEEEFPVTTTYIGNPQSMMETVYRCVFFVAIKR